MKKYIYFHTGKVKRGEAYAGRIKKKTEQAPVGPAHRGFRSKLVGFKLLLKF